MPDMDFANMAQQLSLLGLVGDVINFDPYKKKLLEGGFMPRGGSGRSAEVTRFPDRNNVNWPEQETAARIAERQQQQGVTPYDLAVQRQQAARQPPTAEAGDPAMSGAAKLAQHGMDMQTITRALNDPARIPEIDAIWKQLTPAEKTALVRILRGEP